MSAIGMMEGAYFVGRNELLQWVNATFGLNYKKVEECCSGDLYCRVMHKLYPNKFTALYNRVNHNAKLEYEFIHNWKILQQMFSRAKIEKVIEVERLVKGKYQDNLEFLQWMKRFHDIHCPSSNVEGQQSSQPTTTAEETATQQQVTAGGPKRPKEPSATRPRRKLTDERLKPKRIPPSGQGGGNISNGEGNERLNERVKEMEKERQDMRLAIDGLEKERDFYFGKLRDIEILCQTVQEKEKGTATVESLIERVFGILYATEGEFVAPEDDE